MTKKNFEAIAQIIKNAESNPAWSGDEWSGGIDFARDIIADELADLFADDNPRFDRQRFLTACGI